MDSKKETRSRMRSLLKDRESDLKNLSVNILKNLETLLSRLEINEDQILGCFAPLWDEPQLIHELKLKTSFPLMHEGKMVFSKCSFSELEKRVDFGVEILSPPKNLEVVEPSLILVPGLAFSKKGERLGRGKGFYDRYLENYRGKTIAVCFSFQMEEKLELEKHDMKVNYIVNDKEIIEVGE